MLPKITANFDFNKIIELSELLRKLKISRDKYDDTSFFPDSNLDKELQYGFFTVMVGIDHRARNRFSRFESIINGKKLFGADLLYYKDMQLFKSKPNVFLPEKLCDLNEDLWLDVLKSDYGYVWDYKLRLFLIRDIGFKVLRFYKSFTELFNVDTMSEFRERMRIFRAYEDPVEKKTFLLLKFLDGRGLVTIKDKENFEIPVDNHISRLAIRLGIIKLNDYTFIREGIEVPPEIDIKIRMKIRESWKIVSKESRIDIFALDDFLWKFGREVCRFDSPRCNKCPFKDICMSRKMNISLTEHIHEITWYY